MNSFTINLKYIGFQNIVFRFYKKNNINSQIFLLNINNH